MNPDRSTVLGLAGAGPWGRNFIKTVAGMNGVRLGAVATSQAEVGDLVDERCRIVPSWRDLLDVEEIDGLIIATPPQTHVAIAVAAIGRGIPVLIEKPLTLNVRDARMLLEEAIRRKAIALVDHIYLFHPAFVELRNRVRRAGGPQAIRTTGGNHGPFRPDTPPLWDYGSHDVAMCLDLMGALPTAVEAEIVQRRAIDGSVGEIIRMNLAFERDVHAELTIGNLMPQRRRRLEVVDQMGTTLIFDDTARPLLTEQRIGHSPTPIPVDTTHTPLERVVTAMTSAIGNGEHDVSGLELAVSVVEVLAAAEAQLTPARGC